MSEIRSLMQLHTAVGHSTNSGDGRIDSKVVDRVMSGFLKVYGRDPSGVIEVLNEAVKREKSDG